jgi:hypothetical protein
MGKFLFRRHKLLRDLVVGYSNASSTVYVRVYCTVSLHSRNKDVFFVAFYADRMQLERFLLSSSNQ